MGRAYIKSKTKDKWDEIDRLPMPEYTKLIAFYSDPKTFGKPKKMSKEEALAKREAIKEADRRMKERMKER